MDLNSLVSETNFSAGKWFNFGDAQFLIAPRGGKYESALARLTDAFRKANRNRQPEPDQRRAINIEAAVGTTLLDWKGITKDGAELPFDKKTAIAVLSQFPPVREFVFETFQSETGFFPEMEPGAADPIESAKSEVKSGVDVDAPVQ